MRGHDILRIALRNIRRRARVFLPMLCGFFVVLFLFCAAGVVGACLEGSMDVIRHRQISKNSISYYAWGVVEDEATGRRWADADIRALLDMEGVGGAKLWRTPADSELSYIRHDRPLSYAELWIDGTKHTALALQETDLTGLQLTKEQTDLSFSAHFLDTSYTQISENERREFALRFPEEALFWAGGEMRGSGDVLISGYLLLRYGLSRAEMDELIGKDISFVWVDNWGAVEEGYKAETITFDKGKSAVAAAAYRAGETIANDYDGVTHDYTNKRGIVHTEIMLPENAPSEYANRSVLWNAVEKSERYKTAQLAREIELALPVELSQEQQIALVRDYVKTHFVNAGMCADVCVHDKNDGNPHAHILLTMRPINADGSWGAKSRTVDGRKVTTVDWNEQSKAEEWRTAWEDCCNAGLRDGGFDVTIDHRSYERQGIEQIPTVHLGVAATRLEKRGIRTELGDRNREIAVTNQELRRLNARIRRLQDWLREETANIEQPALYDVVSNILNKRSRRGESNLHMASQVLAFLMENNIRDMAGLEDKVRSMYRKTQELRDKLKPIDRRLSTLDEHLRQTEIYRKNKAIYEKYQLQKPKHRERFHEMHHAEITLFEAADRYFKSVLNGRTVPPVKAWRTEREKLSTERDLLNLEYGKVKGETREVERIRRSVEEILREGTTWNARTQNVYRHI